MLQSKSSSETKIVKFQLTTHLLLQRGCIKKPALLMQAF